MKQAYDVGDNVDGTVTKVGRTHLTLTIGDTTGRLPLSDVRAVARRAIPIVGADMNVTVAGTKRGKLVLSFSPG
jgi:ribosomal protein S1